MPTIRPNTALNFKGDLVFGYGIIEPPHSLGVKAILLDAYHFEVGFANGSEHVSYLYRFCSLSDFLFRPVLFISYHLERSNLGSKSLKWFMTGRAFEYPPCHWSCACQMSALRKAGHHLREHRMC